MRYFISPVFSETIYQQLISWGVFSFCCTLTPCSDRDYPEIIRTFLDDLK